MIRGVCSLPDLAATQALAARLAPLLRAGDVVALYGDLGAGKTEAVRAILRHLGVVGDVPSPTFTLMQSYEVGSSLFTHFDLYRLKSETELDELGWDDALAYGAVFVEWPDRAGMRLPDNRLDLYLFVNATGMRQAEAVPRGAWVARDLS